jgi:hypothetical protein
MRPVIPSAVGRVWRAKVPTVILSAVGRVWRAKDLVLDLLRGLFAFPANGLGGESSPAAAVESRYSRPRHCC